MLIDTNISNRVLAVVNVVLSANRSLTVKDIQLELERLGFHRLIDRRSIYGDIHAMIEWGFPIAIKHHAHNQFVITRRLDDADVTDSRDSNVTQCIS